MHASCRDFVVRALATLPARAAVVEVGAYDVNGSIRGAFPADAEYVGVDLAPGPGVDEVGNGATWLPPATFADGRGPDTFVTLSVLEHTPEAAGILANASYMLRPGGVLVCSTVTDPWPVHSANGGPLEDGEFYHGPSGPEVVGWLAAAPFRYATVLQTPAGDVLAVAFKARDGREAGEPLELVDAPWVEMLGRPLTLNTLREATMPRTNLTPTTCRGCGRVVYKSDTDEYGRCVLCPPPVGTEPLPPEPPAVAEPVPDVISAATGAPAGPKKPA